MGGGPCPLSEGGVVGVKVWPWSVPRRLDPSGLLQELLAPSEIITLSSVTEGGCGGA